VRVINRDKEVQIIEIEIDSIQNDFVRDRKAGKKHELAKIFQPKGTFLSTSAWILARTPDTPTLTSHHYTESPDPGYACLLANKIQIVTTNNYYR
jgi:hypothetical protein